MVKWYTLLNILNPTNESLREMWEYHMSRDGLVDEQTIEYKGFALVGWPKSCDLEILAKFVGDGYALSTLVEDDAFDALKLRQFMELATCNEQDEDGSWDNSGHTPYLKFCQQLCKAVVKANDVELVTVFLSKFFERLKKKKHLAAELAAVGNAFGWSVLRETLLRLFSQLNAYDGMVFAIALAAASDKHGEMYAAVKEIALSRSKDVLKDTVDEYKAYSIGGTAAKCCDEEIIGALATVFNRVDASLMEALVRRMSYSVQASSSEEERLGFTMLASSRLEWLDAEIARLDQGSTLEIRDAVFPRNPEVEAFLRGPEDSYVVRGFPGIAAARDYIKDHAPETNLASWYTMKTRGSGKNSAVVITKTPEKLKEQLDAFKQEHQKLSKTLLAIGSDSVVGHKRPRTD